MKANKRTNKQKQTNKKYKKAATALERGSEQEKQDCKIARVKRKNKSKHQDLEQKSIFSSVLKGNQRIANAKLVMRKHLVSIFQFC